MGIRLGREGFQEEAEFEFILKEWDGSMERIFLEVGQSRQRQRGMN